MANMVKPKKILIIDDDLDRVEANKIILEAHSYQVYTSYDGKDGLVKFFEVLPDLIIMDVAMEMQNEMVYVCHKIRSYPKIGCVPIIMINDIYQIPRFQFSPDTDKIYLQVDEFIDKPVDPSTLVQVANKWLLR